MKHARLASGLVILGLIGIIVWKFLEPRLTENTQTEITDAADFKRNITIAVDGWIGYFPLCSPDLKTRLRREGYGLQCIDDGGNYAERFNKLDSGEYDFVVATVDSYVLNGKAYNYPGAIVAVIDESKGGDAVIARKTVVANLEQLKSLQALRIAYTENSPSHHLLKSIASHFDIPSFKNKSLHTHTQGSGDALKALKKGEVDLAILWEPDVSKALDDPDFVRLLGTEDTRQLIVDILIASRKVARDDEKLIVTLLSHYFKTLKYYGDNPAQQKDAIGDYTKLRDAQVAQLLNGVQWINLNRNAEIWFKAAQSDGIQGSLVTAIEGAVDIQLDNGDFKQHPLPNRDPYRLINSQYISKVQGALGNSTWIPNGSETPEGDIQFTALSSEQWAKLEAVGSLKTRNITFASGTEEITDEGKREIDLLIKDLQHYPTFRIEVRGHTADRGDADMNMALSHARAQAVMNYMLQLHAVQAERVRCVGFGGNKLLEKLPGESDRAWRYRLPRVELTLVKETL